MTTADSMGSEIAAVRARLRGTLEDTKRCLSDGVDTLKDQGNQVVEASNNFVRERPWRAVSIAALAGVAVGSLLTRR